MSCKTLYSAALVLFLFCQAFLSCGKDDGGAAADKGDDPGSSTSAKIDNKLSLSVTDKSFLKEGGNFYLSINANCDWTLESSADWLTSAKYSGQKESAVKITCAPMVEDGLRKAFITVKAEGVSDAVLTVTQGGATFTNPIGGIPDPYIYKDGSWYYLCKASSGINMSRSDKLSHLNSTKTVWSTPVDSGTDKPWNSSHVWAPELHKIDGHWYIYYTAGRPSSESGNYVYQRSGVLRARTDDPLGEWEDMGMLYTGDNWQKGIVPTRFNTKYAIDLTVFSLKGQQYAVWSAPKDSIDNNQALFIATMSDPCTISCSRIMISYPDQSWERYQNKIQEGPHVIKHGGKVFLVYSCNASWTKYYRLGYMVMDESADPLNPNSWTKSSREVFYRCDDTSDKDGVNGVGHCMFTKSPDGTEDWIVYHTKNRNDNTYSTGRSTFIQKFTWKEDGTPDFGTPVGWGEKVLVPSGE